MILNIYCANLHVSDMVKTAMQSKLAIYVTKLKHFVFCNNNIYNFIFKV